MIDPIQSAEMFNMKSAVERTFYVKSAKEVNNKKAAMGDEFPTYTVSTMEEGKHETDRKMKLPQQEPSVLSMCPDDSYGGDIVGVPVRTSHVVQNLPRGDGQPASDRSVVAEWC